MNIERLHICNYRTLVDVELQFPSFYTAICGKNDCGKTNIVRALRGLMKAEESFDAREEPFSLKKDFPQWLDVDPEKSWISLCAELCIHSESDAGLYDFLNTYLSLNCTDPEMHLSLKEEFGAKDGDRTVSVGVGNQTFSDMKAQEVLKKLQTARVVLFHNSAYEDRPVLNRDMYAGVLRDFYGDAREQVESLKTTVDKNLKRIAKGQQREIEALLGRLKSKYKVGLSIPTLGFEYVPFNITLGDAKIDVSLEDWGSGTRNYTQILLTLLRAKQVTESETSASKITPIILIEEPESFLHPSAQAEFGQVLRDLAEEFRVQVITTTHSPYMLSLDKPESNILLERKITRNQQRETCRVNTSGDRWMEPFGQALGVKSADFAPWKEVLFSQSDSILLVEGDIDRQYFELLRNPAHGANQLRFSGEIFPYGGHNSLKNTMLLRFIVNRYRHVFVTYDLDSEEFVEGYLTTLGLEKKKQYAPVGLNKSGGKCIEGLVPTKVTAVVYAANTELVQAAMVGAKKGRDAKLQLKRKILEQFKAEAQPTEEYYEHFYPLVRLINRSLS